MMHYRKGENIEQELSKDELPFDDCMPKEQRNFLWMHVKGGTKVTNVINYAKNALEKGEYRTVVWSGSGGGVIKTISCAEILKRSFALYQVTRMCYVNVQEHWKPQMDGLEEIVATRQIPCLHILMSLDELDASINGLQKPNTVAEFWEDTKSRPMQQNNRSNQQQQPQQQHSRPVSTNTNKQQKRPRQQTSKPAKHNRETNQATTDNANGNN